MFAEQRIQNKRIYSKIHEYGAFISNTCTRATQKVLSFPDLYINVNVNPLNVLFMGQWIFNQPHDLCRERISKVSKINQNLPFAWYSIVLSWKKYQ